VLTDAAWWSVALIALVGMGVAGLFVLGHDASHGALFASPGVNKQVARWCMVPSLHNDAAWDLGHNRIHHGYTARIGFDFVWHPATAEEYAAMSRFHRLRHRLDWSCLGSGTYYLRAVWWEKMVRYRPEGKRADAYRRDNRFLYLVFAAVVVAVTAIGLVQGGPTRALWLILATLVIPFLIFGQVIGWTVYVHHVDPQVKWWPRRDWNQFKGQMESTTVLEFPKLIDALWLHHIFVHTPHHVDMRIPFHQLPAAAAAIEAAFPGVVRHEKWGVRSYLRATKQCKLYDVDAMSWTQYR
jgi:omega-6 fatty acid desaturase (delta-12 desaturase)